MTEQTGRPKQLTADDVLESLADSSLPFTTSKLVADDNLCSTATARNRLNELVDDGELERYKLDGRRSLYFRPDYEAAADLTDTLRGHLDLGGLELAHLEAFAKEPYKMLPKSENEYYVVTPRFVPFHIGHLHEQDEAWQVFVINKYVAWIEELPDEIREQLDIGQQYDDLRVEDNLIELTNPDEQGELWDDLGGRDAGLYQKQGEDAIKIKRGSEFDVIADLIERGHLPFTPKPIDEGDLRGEPDDVSLRSYQERAWEKFRENGQIGVYWPPGAGKTFLSLYAGERVTGKKLVVVPTSTLEQQWEERIKEVCDRPREWEVRTYQYLTHGNSNLDQYQGDGAPALTIFDECHRLPANTFSKLATIETNYRIGLSASPYREDGRTDYIFALTGYPVGINWQELVELGVVDYPTVWVYLYRTANQKLQDTVALAGEKPGKGVIFCDSLDRGKELAAELDVPFVSGETPKGDRMDLVRDNRIAVVSRVGDEGMSLEELDWTIEHDFHGGSRRQELQRTGRVMHGTSENSQHIIQMTDDEAEKFSERLYSLEQRGMELSYERRS